MSDRRSQERETNRQTRIKNIRSSLLERKKEMFFIFRLVGLKKLQQSSNKSSIEFSTVIASGNHSARLCRSKLNTKTVNMNLD